MLNLNEIIAQIQRDLNCPVCSKKYEISEIRLRGLVERTIIIQTICSNGHMALFMTTVKAKDEKIQPISNNDILDIYNALNDFDGDFITLWKN